MRTYENAGIAGLGAGAVAGVIMGGVGLVLLVLLKDQVIQTLASATQNAGGNGPTPQALYQSTLVTAPLVLFFINLVVGAITGFALGRVVSGQRSILVGVSIVVGVIIGFLVSLPISRLVTAGIGIVAWLAFAAVFSTLYDAEGARASA
jgi:hypothetical protein